MKRIRYLIMEHLPGDGRDVMVEDLQQNVSLDAQYLNVDYTKHLFDNILTQLVEDQYVVNLGGKIIATKYGLVKSNIFC